MVIFFDFLATTTEYQNTSISEESAKLLLEFTLSQTVLLHPLLEDNVKISAMDLNKELSLNYKKLFNLKN